MNITKSWYYSTTIKHLIQNPFDRKESKNPRLRSGRKGGQRRAKASDKLLARTAVEVTGDKPKIFFYCTAVRQ